MMSETYSIVRVYRDSDHPDHLKIIETGLTLEEAQAHCRNPETRDPGVWCDGYQED